MSVSLLPRRCRLSLRRCARILLCCKMTNFKRTCPESDLETNGREELVLYPVFPLQDGKVGKGTEGCHEAVLGGFYPAHRGDEPQLV